ncbi:UNVERIFIED_CONTAM: hypothetical protein NCL1_48545 [Trichonephila clavipes]
MESWNLVPRSYNLVPRSHCLGSFCFRSTQSFSTPTFCVDWLRPIKTQIWAMIYLRGTAKCTEMVRNKITG